MEEEESSARWTVGQIDWSLCLCWRGVGGQEAVRRGSHRGAPTALSYTPSVGALFSMQRRLTRLLLILYCPTSKQAAMCAIGASPSGLIRRPPHRPAMHYEYIQQTPVQQGSIPGSVCGG